MGNKYPGRPLASNKMVFIHARILQNQLAHLEKLSQLYHLNKSEILREALTSWLNINTPIRQTEEDNGTLV